MSVTHRHFCCSNHLFQKGFSVNGNTTWNNQLETDFNFDYSNLNESGDISNSTSEVLPYTYRLTQIAVDLGNITVPQLSLTLWSGKEYY